MSEFQAVAREKLHFTNVYVGWPVKMHDACILVASPLVNNGARLWG